MSTANPQLNSVHTGLYAHDRFSRGEIQGGFGHFTYNPAEQLLVLSDGAAVIFGLNDEQCAVSDWIQLALPQYREAISQALEIVWVNGNSSTLEYEIGFGAQQASMAVCVTLTKTAGEHFIFGTVNKLPVVQQSNQQLKNREEMLRLLIADMNIGVILQGPNTEMLLNNAKALELLGLTQSQLNGRTSLDKEWKTIHEDGSVFPGEMHPAPRAIATGKSVRDVTMGVYHPLKKDFVWLLITAIPTFKQDESIRNVIVTFTDITQQKTASKEIERLNTELTELTRHLQHIRTAEINKLAVEIHDKLGQNLVGLRFQIDKLVKKQEEELMLQKDSLLSLSASVNSMIDDFKKIYYEVNPTLLEHLDLCHCIEYLVQGFKKTSSIQINFSTPSEICNYSYDLKFALFKFTEECLQNIRFHSHATEVDITLIISEKEIVLSVADNGIGFLPELIDISAEHGILEMRERVNAINGKLIITTSAESGTVVSVKVDL